MKSLNRHLDYMWSWMYDTEDWKHISLSKNIFNSVIVPVLYKEIKKKYDLDHLGSFFKKHSNQLFYLINYTSFDFNVSKALHK